MTGADRPRRSTWRHVFGMPIRLAAITLVGLLAALIGDDLWDVLSWLALAIPLAVICRYVGRPIRARGALAPQRFR